MADIIKAKEAYSKIEKEYGLPEFSELEKYFTFTELNEEIVLVDIRRKIQGLIEHFASYIENLVQPDSNYSSMYEANILNDNDKKVSMELFKKFMYYIREGDRVSIIRSDKEEAEYIKAVFNMWKENRDTLVLFAEKLRDSWNGDSKLESGQEYFG